jgi:hypothetical protein
MSGKGALKFGTAVLALVAVAAPASALAFGTFARPHAYRAGRTPFGIVAADVNRDGHPDLLVTNVKAPGSLSILHGRGDGTFRKAKTIPLGGNPIQIALGRFNADHRTDIAVSNLDGRVQVLLAKGNGFGAPHDYSSGGIRAHGVVAADFDRDGVTDLAATNEVEKQVSILPGIGGGAFGPPFSLPVAQTPVSIATGQLSGDHHLDLAVGVADLTSYAGKILLLQGTPGGGFRPPRAFPIKQNPLALTIADLDRDGHRDVIVADFLAKAKAKATIELLYGRAGAALSSARTIHLGRGQSRTGGVTAADFNRDGWTDIAVSIQAKRGRVAVLLGRGHRRFRRPREYPIGSMPGGIVAVRLDGDAAPDLAAADGGANAARVFLNRP